MNERTVNQIIVVRPRTKCALGVVRFCTITGRGNGSSFKLRTALKPSPGHARRNPPEAAALAKEKKAELVTGDPEFKRGREKNENQLSKVTINACGAG
jgi:hypothetical protein